MSKLKISHVEIADDLLLKKSCVKIGDKKIETPIKAIDLTKRRPDLPITDQVKGLNEICKVFNEKNLNEYLTGARNETILNNEMERTKNKAGENEINVNFVFYEGLRYPNEKGINFLMDVAYEYSDITPLPILPKLSKKIKENQNFQSEFEDYKIFMQKCIDSVNRLNNQDIMGIIPESITSSFIPELIDFYHNNNITSFVYDFGGKVSTGMRTKIRELMISLNELDILENSFLYSINANNGKMLHDVPVVRAKDVLTYGFGFSALGDQHIRKFLPEDLRKILLEKEKKRIANSENPQVTLFNTNDYGYYKTSDISVLDDIYSHGDTKIPIKYLKKKSVTFKPAQSLFNSERIGIEAIKYRQIIKDQSSNTYDYFKPKKYIEENDLKKLLKFRKDIRI
ncbi:MAG TPA: hypothetical protein HA367_08480 [Candidatus Methanofastidiosum sp.]|nr:hypothetical protein [Methanofastidiosum sp.]